MTIIDVKSKALLAYLALFPGITLAQDLSENALRQCAQAGVSECQFKYGQMLQHGQRIPRDLTEAKRLYEAAYTAGYQPAGQALLNLLSSPKVTDDQSTSESTTTSLSQEAPTTAKAAGSTTSAKSAIDQCREPKSSPAHCMPSATGTPIELKDKRLAVLLHIQNPTSDRAYVSRGRMRAYQADQRVAILDASRSTSWGRTATRTTTALGFLVDLIPVKPGIPTRSVSRNLGKTAASKAVDTIPTPSGRANYLSVGYVEPMSSMTAVIVVEIVDQATPISVEMDIGDGKSRFSVPLPHPQS